MVAITLHIETPLIHFPKSGREGGIINLSSNSKSWTALILFRTSSGRRWLVHLNPGSVTGVHPPGGRGEGGAFRLGDKHFGKPCWARTSLSRSVRDQFIETGLVIRITGVAFSLSRSVRNRACPWKWGLWAWTNSCGRGGQTVSVGRPTSYCAYFKIQKQLYILKHMKLFVGIIRQRLTTYSVPISFLLE